MDGRTDEWTDMWIAELRVKWMNGCIYEWMEKTMNK